MQDTTCFCRVPRTDCPTHGVKSTQVPWADTLLFERFAIDVLLVKVAKMIKSHLDNILTYLEHLVTNAKAEGFNSKIQSIKSVVRGFRSFKNYRTVILFYGGGASIAPTEKSEGLTLLYISKYL